jgi:hypothetical protein
MRTSIFKSSVVAWLGVVWLCMAIFVTSTDQTMAQPCGPGTGDVKIVKKNLTPCYWTPTIGGQVGVEIILWRTDGTFQRHWADPTTGANSVEYVTNTGVPFTGQIVVEGKAITIPTPGSNPPTDYGCTGINGAQACTNPTCQWFSAPFCPCLHICVETIGGCPTITLEEIPGPCSPCPANGC